MCSGCNAVIYQRFAAVAVSKGFVMVLPNGHLSTAEKRFAEAMAITGDKAYAAAQTGSKHTAVTAHRFGQKPEVQAEIARIQTERLFSEVLPLAVEQHLALLRNAATPAGARVQAIKLAYDRTLGGDDAHPAKEPHEMSADEIAEAISKLESVAAARAKPIDDAPSEDVFA